MNVAIVGSREYMDLDAVWEYVRHLPPDTVVVSGGARGVDMFAAAAARHYGLEVIEHLPDWKTHGKAAGYIRNEAIVKDADRLVAFWDGRSKGTRHSINLAELRGIPVEVNP